MKITTSLLLSAITLCVTSCHCTQKVAKTGDNTQNSIDYTGTYNGTLPTAAGPGVETTLVLRPDMTYSYTAKYIDRQKDATTTIGKYSWRGSEPVIVLQDNEAGSKYFKVGENRLIQLDVKGNVIKSDMVDKYILAKQAETITDKRWKLTELNGEKIVVQGDFNNKPFLVFKTEDGRLTGNAGCNIINGPYTLNGNALKIGMLISTMMACPNLELEGKFMQMVGTVESYIVSGDKLTLSNAEGVEVAKFEAIYM